LLILPESFLHREFFRLTKKLSSNEAELATSEVNLANAEEKLRAAINNRRRFALPTFAYVAFALAISMISYLAVFGTRVMPNVPEQYGGALPRQVRMLLLTDTLDALQSIGITYGPENVVEGLLLWEGEGSFIVRAPSGQGFSVVRIDKNMVPMVALRTETIPTAQDARAEMQSGTPIPTVKSATPAGATG